MLPRQRIDANFFNRNDPDNRRPRYIEASYVNSRRLTVQSRRAVSFELTLLAGTNFCRLATTRSVDSLLNCYEARAARISCSNFRYCLR